MRVTAEPHLRAFWYPLGFVDEIDQPVPRRLLGEDLVLWRPDPAGPVLAALDRCPHRDARLSAGRLTDGTIQCAYHGWRFADDGVVVDVPQLEADSTLPPKGCLSMVRTAERYGVVWVALDEPCRPVPEVPELAGLETGEMRFIRQFDEEWNCAAPRLLDNNFDVAHVAFVHLATLGRPSRPTVEVPTVERTDFGMVVHQVQTLENDMLDEAASVTGTDEELVTRHVTNSFFAPGLLVYSIDYRDTGIVHTLFIAATPVDDDQLRLVQFCARNDTEADVPAADIVAFDRKIIEEDRWILELCAGEYELDLGANAHVKHDRPTVEIRRILGEICAGEWA